MAMMYCLALWTAVIGYIQCCPEQCTCQDRYASQLADCAYKSLQVVPVGLPSNVTTVSLTANQITALNSKSFVAVTQVTSLWLSHNKIFTIETGTLAPLVQLRNLDVSNNKIVDFPWDDFRNLTALQLLKMNHNEMISLPKDALSALTELRSLRINDNKFITIVQGTFKALVSMSHLQIYNNPFNCSCTLEWLRDWILNSKISIPERDSIICDGPGQLKGALVVNMPKLECSPPNVHITYQPNIKNTELYEGFMVILNCETKGIPGPEVKWEILTGNQHFEFSLPGAGNEKNDFPVNAEKYGGRFLVFQNGTLIIPRMSKKEEGNYSCLAVNEMGRAGRTVTLMVAGAQKHRINYMPETGSKNNDTADRSTAIVANEQIGSMDPSFARKCGARDGTQYISNHAFNLSLDKLKQYTFDFGVIALEVSETEAKVQLNPLGLPNVQDNLHQSPSQEVGNVNKMPVNLNQASSKKASTDMLYVCVDTGNGHSVVQWSKIESGINAYHFRSLKPGTNYTLCLTYGGEDCQVQVVFTTRKKIPSLLIIVAVSIFLLALATVPLLWASCCHLLYKYQDKTYKLIMKAQNPVPAEKHVPAALAPRASCVRSEENYGGLDEKETGAEVEEGTEDGVRAEGSLVTESIAGSQSRGNQEEFEVGSEYSDRLPLGAEAVNISEEINGNHKHPAL